MAFRVVFSALCIALGISIAVITVRGIHAGRLMWPSRYQPHVYVDHLTRPAMFWLAAVFYIVLCCWLLYSSVAEILYATRRHKRH